MSKSRSHEDDSPEELSVLFRTGFRNTILDVLSSKRGWKETSDDVDWDFYWCDCNWVRDNIDKMQFNDTQKVHHFPNHQELTRKDLLVKNLKRMKKQLQRTDAVSEANKYDFWCTTFVLPTEYGLFLEEFKRNPGAVWIMKPIGRAQGRGIFLFEKLSEISEWKKDHKWKSDGPQAETYVVQKYVEKPYTIGGKKFDLRLYVLVTSFSPLVFWMYRTGFARFSNSRYTNNKTDIDNLYMHLTNASIQKHAESYDKTVGCKWALQSLKMFLISKHGLRPVDELFYNIQCLITRSLLSVQQTIIQDKHCFELYGYDILIDSSLKPWLIEVNASPSLTGDTDRDYGLKYNLINDTIDVVDVERKLNGDEKHVGGFDLIWNNGPVRNAHPNGYSTFLGCAFDTVTVKNRPTRKKNNT